MEFAEILKGAKSEGKENHLPVIDVDKERGIVNVVVGKETPHPNTMEHRISWIEVFGVKNDGRIVCIGRGAFAAAYTSPDVHFKVPLKEFKALCALSYCNVHGLWQNCIELV